MKSLFAIAQEHSQTQIDAFCHVFPDNSHINALTHFYKVLPNFKVYIFVLWKHIITYNDGIKIAWELRNQLKLLAAMGFDSELVDGANAKANQYTADGKWM